jgi:hypothetical protein
VGLKDGEHEVYSRGETKLWYSVGCCEMKRDASVYRASRF